MVKTVCLNIITFIVAAHNCANAQSLFRRSAKTFYISYARHLPTKYIVDSGSNKLISRKMNVSIEGGINIDVSLKNKWSLRSGVNVHFHFISESSYGTTGGLPPVFPPNASKDYGYDRANKYTGNTVENSDLTTFSIPIKALYQISTSRKWQLYADGGPVLAIYTPVNYNDDAAKYWELPNQSGGYTAYQQFELNRTYKRSIFPTSTGISPQLEWEAGIEARHLNKKRGAWVLGAKMHLGSNKVERSTFTIWPTLPAHRSKGHYTLNRSYVGLYVGYRLGRNAPEKR